MAAQDLSHSQPPSQSQSLHTTNDNIKRNDRQGSRMPVKKNRQRSSSSLECSSSGPSQDHSLNRSQFSRSSLSFSTELEYTASEAATVKQSPGQGSSSHVEFSLLPSSSQKYPKHPKEKETGLASLKPLRNGCGVPWQWSRMHKGIRRRRRVIRSMGRTSTEEEKHRARASKATCSQGQIFSSEEDSIEDIDPRSQDSITHFTFNSAYLSGHNCQYKGRDKRSHSKKECHSCTSLSSKYQPKLFQDIVGHEIIIKAISNAAQQKKVAPLYLFHGPSGTGKTSTARIFVMALNCESTSLTKPCGSCRGCSRSLYIMELCSGSRISGFERIRTLLQNTTFTQAISGFKVFIIEECHSLTTKAWNELLHIVERGYGSTMVFIVITDDANMVPRAISSRCQKFCFPKLKDMDITLKLTRIVAQEHIGIDREALKLITAKAEGSLREAENILDQLVLLGSNITSSIVQQLVGSVSLDLPEEMSLPLLIFLFSFFCLQVGLVPHNKLIDLLTTAISADTIKTIRLAMGLIASGVEPHTLVSQLASLITEILSGAASSSSAGSSKDKTLLRKGPQLSKLLLSKLCNIALLRKGPQLSKLLLSKLCKIAHLLMLYAYFAANNQSARLCHALKILVETKRQLSSSSDNTTWVVAALLQIASEEISNSISTGVVLPREIITPSDDKSNVQSIGIQLNGLYLDHQSKGRPHHHSINRTPEEADISTNDPGTTTRRIDVTRGKTVEREPNLTNLIDMEEVWQNILGRLHSRYVREFLSHQSKLASLTMSSANAIVHLMFKRPEDKLAAQMSEKGISQALKIAIGCPVTVNMSLEPVLLGIIESNSISAAKSQIADCGSYTQTPFLSESELSFNQNAGVIMHSSTSKKFSLSENNLKSMKLQESIQITQGREDCPSGGQEASITRPQQTHPFYGLLTQESRLDASVDPKTDLSTRDQAPTDTTNIRTATMPKHRWPSLSSIQQGDASVEPYSQDLLFEKANTGRAKGVRRKLQLDKGFSKANEDHNFQHSRTRIGFNRSWSCTDILCQGKTKINNPRQISGWSVTSGPVLHIVWRKIAADPDGRLTMLLRVSISGELLAASSVVLSPTTWSSMERHVTTETADL
ncbi:hypothetical protein HHK36_008878 [Tetracentron sinense]|uniref:AAA+ ATPase domain-containing protein n=1 Tax=Tetracentron sinense TaxID=13715 RepID=A0A835DKD9_TETSI|nr:hypothetical protein HHK36_008878 [Tetracentron sinense]